jgi:hypothetical protein
MPTWNTGSGRPFSGWGQRDVRASDADRERAVDMLRQHAGDGRISIEELSQRTEHAYSAQTLGELDVLVRDLPPAPVDGGPGGSVGKAHRGVVVPMGKSNRRLRYTAIRLAIIDVACIAIWAVTGGPTHAATGFWPAWPIVGGAVWLGFRGVRRAERQHRQNMTASFMADVQNMFPNMRAGRRQK